MSGTSRLMKAKGSNVSVVVPSDQGRGSASSTLPSSRRVSRSMASGGRKIV